MGFTHPSVAQAVIKEGIMWPFKRKKRPETVICRICGCVVEKESATYSMTSVFIPVSEYGRTEWYCQRCAKETKREIVKCPHCSLRFFAPTTVEWTRYKPMAKKKRGKK